MSAKKITTEIGVSSQLEEELSTHGIAGMFKRIPERTDMSVETHTTGLPRLDKILHEKSPGIPLRRDIEIRSKQPEVGKTSIGMNIVKAFQDAGKKTAIIDIENTITDEMFNIHGIAVEPLSNNIYPPYLSKGYDPKTGAILPAEQILALVGHASNLFDLVLVDSLPAMAKLADLEKDPTDSSAPGGIGKMMFDHMRKHVKKEATVLWINQNRQKIGGYNPSNQQQWKPSGGDALQYFGTIQIELSLIEKLKAKNPDTGEDEFYGMKVLANVVKNKVSPQWRSVDLTYINGRGFCPIYDVYEIGKKLGIIEKSGAWIKFQDYKYQGEVVFYRAMCTIPELYSAIQTAISEKVNNATM